MKRVVEMRMDELESAFAQPGTSSSKHDWLVESLTNLILTKLQPGDMIPSERRLSELAGVSRMTARRAIDELAADGLVNREIGRGTFVAAASLDVPLHLSSFSEEMVSRGLSKGGRQISSRIIGADLSLAQALSVPVGTRVWVLERVRETEGEPIALEKLHMVSTIAPGLEQRDLGEASVYQILAEEFDVVPDAAVETVRSRNARAREAGLLGIREGAAVLHRTRTATWKGSVVEYTVSTYRGDRFMLRAEIELPGRSGSGPLPKPFGGPSWSGVPL